MYSGPKEELSICNAVLETMKDQQKVWGVAVLQFWRMSSVVYA